MPRQNTIGLENDFNRGLITEASGLNFPEKACTETYDCVFKINGTVSRRLGFDYEPDYTTKSIDTTNKAISSFFWKNAAGNGNINLFVAQIGDTVYFWDTSGNSVSEGQIESTVSLSTYKTSGSPGVSNKECQFSSSTEYLVITHPYCEPVKVKYNPSTNAVSHEAINIMVRDWEGDLEDPYDVDERPTATLSGLNVHHKYNLYNQGWSTTNLTAWDTSETTMPSNTDVMWRFKNTDDEFDTTTIPNVTDGNSPANKAHFILSAWNLDRDTASGLTGTTSTTSGYERPTTSAFYAGRIFYSGVNASGYSTSIYFTQILEREDQYGSCYQTNDPTSENLFDLLPSDGGVFKIEEAGTIYKLVAIPGYLLIFARNGVWAISGSTGLGFTANDFTIQRISTIETISATPFVDVAGLPAWWNLDGIYLIQMVNGAPGVKDLTQTTIKSFYQNIPSVNRANARGFFNPVDGIIQWLYRSNSPTDISESYTFDRILNFNVITGAFYPWKISQTGVRVHGVFISSTLAQFLNQYDVINDDEDLVVDDDGNQVIAFGFGVVNTISKSFKFLVSQPKDSSFEVTFAETNALNHIDWLQYDLQGVPYESYFVSGFKLAGGGINKFQPVWLNIFSETDEAVKYHIQGIWDYSNTGDTGRWSAKSYVEHLDTNYSNAYKRIKIRGHGKILQFKVTSIENDPFHIIGWSTFNAINQLS